MRYIRVAPPLPNLGDSTMRSTLTPITAAALVFIGLLALTGVLAWDDITSILGKLPS